jgi:hypothetical protein
MAWNFRRSRKILPGVRVNISKKSSSVSFGCRWFRRTISTTGKARTTVGLPGTGLSYTKTTGHPPWAHPSPSGQRYYNAERVETSMKWYQKSWAAVLLLIFFFPVGLFLMWKYQPWKKGVKIAVTALFAVMVIGSAANQNNTPTAPVSDDISSTVISTETSTSAPTTAEITTTEKNTVTTYPTTTRITTTPKATEAKKPTTTRAPAVIDNSRTVYVTPGGKRYHYDPDCGGKNAYSISLNSAIAQGYTPCQKCVH